MVSPAKRSGSSVMWDKKNRQNRDTPIMRNIFDTRRFLKLRRVLLRKFLELWDKNLPTEIRDIPILWLKIFDTRKWWNTKGFLAKNFGIVRQKIIDRNTWCPRLSFSLFLSHSLSLSFSFSLSLSEPWKFTRTDIFWNIERLPYEYFLYCGTKNFLQKIVIYTLIWLEIFDSRI